MTPDHYFPGNGGLLARRLGMKTTHALDIRMQCTGFLSGLQTADAFIRSGMYDRILLVGAEVHSGLMPWPEAVWDVMLGKSPGPCDPFWFERATGMRDRAVLFGDGAGAMVLEANTAGDGRGFLGFAMYTDGEHWDKLYVPGGGCKSRPYFTPEMFENLGTIPIVEGRQVFRLAAQLMPAAVQEVLAGNGRTLADLDLLLMHQANQRISEAAQKVLGLPDDKVFNNIEKYGNTTAGTLPIAFHEAKLAGRVKRGSLVAFTALGAGLHWGGGTGGRLAAHAGCRATEDPTHVKSLLKSTPSILPRDSRHRLSPSVGASSASGRKNIIRTSTLTPPPSTARRHGS